MNTKFQKSTATTPAPVQVSSFVENADTKKVFVKRFDNLGMFEQGRWAEMRQWCEDNLYHGGHFEPNWNAIYPSFYFWDEKEYTMFLLRWS